MEQDLAQVMNRPTSAYDSHPAIKERLDLVSRLTLPASEDNPAPALDLLPNREQLQAEMTVKVERNVKEQARRMRVHGR